MEMAQQIGKEYLPNSIMVGSKEDGNLELLKNRSVPGRTLTYICQEGACKLPVSTAKDALQQL